MLFSQIDSTHLKFYPLHVGNEWIYKSITYEYSNTGLDTIKKDTIYVEIAGDTIFLILFISAAADMITVPGE